MSEYVICIDNSNYPASLITGKVYRTIPEADAIQHNMLRVIDEDLSEPDGYLYPASLFASIQIPEAAEHVFSFSNSD